MRIYALQPSEDGVEAKLLRTLKPHSTPVVVAAVDSTSSLLATGGADGVVKVWDLRGGYTTHTFHGHSGVVSALHFFQVDAIADDASARSKKRKSSQINGSHASEPDAATLGLRLASGGEDGKVRIWDLHKRKSAAILDSHSSIVRSLDFSSSAKALLSASRDQTAIIWDATSWQSRSIIPALESLESAGFIHDSAYLYTAGERGRTRIWSSVSGEEITTEQPPGAETDAILQVLSSKNVSFLLTVHADQTLLLHSLASFPPSSAGHIDPLPITRRISGTHDEVIDLAYIGTQRDLLALATNLEEIRIISLKDSRDCSDNAPTYFGADVALLHGHSDVIITLDTDWSGHWLATGAKDNTARLWRLDPDIASYTCYATFTGHAESIGAVALPNATPQTGSKEYENPLSHPPKFLITGSQDKTVKRWDIATQAEKSSRAVYTRKAHDKDINAIETSFSSTTPLFASASQDRTVKIWDVETGEAIGVLRGHKRGVWTVAFAPPTMPGLSTNTSGGASTSKGMIVTGSGDKSVRIWSLHDYSCLRTFEGHANSVLKVVWLPVRDKGGRQKTAGGVQVASAAGDGLVKIWDAQEGECATTLDNHIDRVWALAVRPAPVRSGSEQDRNRGQDTEMNDDDRDANTEPAIELVSGSADSTLTFWADTTASTALQVSTKATERIEQDQELQNHIRSNNYREAIVLALQLNHPKRLLDFFTAVVGGPHDAGSLTGRKEVDEVLASLSDTQLWNLLKRLRDWNANARTHHVAQRILYAILRLFPKERLVNLRKRQKPSAAAIQDESSGTTGDLTDSMAELTTRERAQSKETVKDIIDALKAYTERHLSRLEKTADERFVLLWALQQMDEVGGGEVELDQGVLNGNGHAMRNGDDMMLNGVA